MYRTKIPKLVDSSVISVASINELIDLINSNFDSINDPRQIVTNELPQVGKPGITYYVPLPDEDKTDDNQYSEWKWINNKWELIGSISEIPPVVSDLQPITFTLNGEAVTYDGTEDLQVLLDGTDITYDGTQAVVLDIDSYVTKSLSAHTDKNLIDSPIHGLRINDNKLQFLNANGEWIDVVSNPENHTLRIKLDGKEQSFNNSADLSLDIDSYVEATIKKHTDQVVDVNTNPDGVHGTRINEGVVQYWDTINQIWVDAAGGAGAAGKLLPPSEFNVVRTDDDKIQITFSDSGNRMSGSDVLVAWMYSVVVRKVGSAPVDMNDGVVIINNSVLNQYQTSPFVDDTAVIGNDYYYALFCIDENDVAVRYKDNPININFVEILAENPTDVVVHNRDQSFNITYTISDARTNDIKLVYNTEHYPASITDGTVVPEYTSGTAVNNLVNGTTYYCTLFASNRYGNYNSGYTCEAIPVEDPASAVTNLKIKSSDSTLTLSYTIDNTNTSKVRIVYKTDEYPTGPSDGTVIETADSQYEITGLINDVTYYFRVYSINLHGTLNENEYSEVQGIPAIQRFYTVNFTGSDPVGIRADDAVGLTAEIEYLGSGVTPTNDFDNIYPWSEMKPVYLNQDGTESEDTTYWKMVRIPKFYLKTDYNTYFSITDKPADGYSVPQAFKRSDGTEKDCIYISSYEPVTNSNIISGVYMLTSVTKNSPSTYYNYESFMTYATNIGDGWHIPMYTEIFTVIIPLFIIEFATKNSQSIFYGVVNYSSGIPMDTGKTDDLVSPSGVAVSSKDEDTGSYSFRYRYIENLYGSTNTILSGYVSKEMSQVYVAPYSEYISSSTDYQWHRIPYSSSMYGYISQLSATDLGIPYITEVGGSNSTYYCDNTRIHVQNSVTASAEIGLYGGYYSSGAEAGLFKFEGDLDARATSQANGTRLVYTNL